MRRVVIMSIGFWQIVFLLVLLLLFFGRGKIPQLMGDIAQGIKSFKKGISDADTDQQEISKPVEQTQNNKQ